MKYSRFSHDHFRNMIFSCAGSLHRIDIPLKLSSTLCDVVLAVSIFKTLLTAEQGSEGVQGVIYKISDNNLFNTVILRESHRSSYELLSVKDAHFFCLLAILSFFGACGDMNLFSTVGGTFYSCSCPEFLTLRIKYTLLLPQRINFLARYEGMIFIKNTTKFYATQKANRADQCFVITGFE